MVQIPDNTPQVLIPDTTPQSTTDDITAWHAAVNFQDEVLNPNLQPGDVNAAMEIYRAAVDRESEDTARRVAMAEEYRNRVTFLTEAVGSHDPETAAAMIRNIGVRDTALEETSIDNQLNYATAVEEAQNPVEVIDERALYLKKLAIVQRDLEKEIEIEAGLGLGKKIANLGGSLLGFNGFRNSIGNVDLAGEDSDPNWFNPLQGQRIHDEVFELMHNTRSIEEFLPKYEEFKKRVKASSGIFGVNNDLVIQRLETLTKFNDPGVISFANLESLANFSDVAPLAIAPLKIGGRVLSGGASAAFRAIKNPAALARMTGNVKTAAALGAKNAHNHLQGIKQMPFTGSPNLSVADQYQEASQYIKNHFQDVSKYKNQSQLREVIASTKDYLDSFYPDSVIDVRFQKQNTVGGDEFTEFVDVYIGDVGFGGGATLPSKTAANRLGQQLGLKSWTPVQDQSTGRWMLKVQHRPHEPRQIMGLDTDDISGSGVKSGFAGARQLIDERTYSNSVQATFRQAGIAEQFKPLIKRIGSLKKTEKQDFDVITQKGMTTGRGVWYNDASLRQQYQNSFNRLPTQKEIDAYHAFRAIHQLDYDVRNLALREQLAFDGWRALDQSTGVQGLARLTDTIPHNVTVYDINGNAVPLGPNDAVVQLMEAIPNPQGGFPITYLRLDKARDLKELPDRVLGVTEGGHRFNDASVFIKQSNNVPNPDGIHVYHPRTATAAQTVKEGDEIAKAMNDVNDIFKRWRSRQLTDTQADSLIQGHRTLSHLTVAQIDNMFKNGHWNPDEVWEAVADGQLPSRTNEALGRADAINYTTGVNDNVLFADRIGRMYYSQRGNPLKSFETGQPLPVVNVFESIARATASAVKTGAWSKYSLEAVTSWVNTARSLNAVSNTEVLKRSPWEILKHADLKHKDVATQLKLEQARKQILWNIDPQTPDSKFFDNLRRSAHEMLYDKDKGPAKQYPNLTDFVENRIIKNPLQTLRGITFDRILGLFGADQLWAQSTTFMTAAVMHGPKAVVDTIPWSIALRSTETVRGFKTARDFQNYLRTVAQHTGVNVQELIARSEALDRLGVMRVGGELAEIQAMGNYVESSRVFGAIENVRQKGRVFFNWAEQNNRLVAFNIAWDLAKKQGLDPLSQEGLNFLALKVDDFSFNMTRAGTAVWQRGVPSLFTQFFGYTGKYIDNLYGKNFTKAQKARLWFANFALFGAAGVPYGRDIAEYYGLDEGTFGDGWADQIMAGFVGIALDGGIDTVLTKLTGTETDAAYRVSPAMQIEELHRSLMLEGPSAIFDTPVGGTVEAGLNLFKPYGKIWNLRYTMQQPDPATFFAEQSLDAVTDLVVPWDRQTKAWYIWKSQRMEDRIGVKILEDIEGTTTTAAIMTALGVPFKDVTEVSRHWQDRERQDQIEYQLARSLAREMNRAYWLYSDGKYDEAEKAEILINNMSAALEDDPPQMYRVQQMARSMWAENGSREWNDKLDELDRE